MTEKRKTGGGVVVGRALGILVLLVGILFAAGLCSASPLAAVAVLLASGCGSSKTTPTGGASVASTTPPTNATGASASCSQT